MLKVTSTASLSENRKDFISAMAYLELVLPVYWQVISHHLLCHAHDQIENMGAFWAQNMLAIERLHVLLKQLARGTRNLMSSIMNNYNIYDAAHTEMRGDTSFKWTSEPRRSSLAADRYLFVKYYIIYK